MQGGTRTSGVRWAVLVTALGLLAGASGCQDTGPAAPDGGTPGGRAAGEDAGGGGWPPVNTPADTVVGATLVADPETLDPAWTYFLDAEAIVMNMYDRLVGFEREKPDAFVPSLATEWTLSDDKTVYTFALREGVRFHAGGTLEPHDVAYSLQRAMLQDRSAGPIWMYLKPVLGVSSIASLAVELADAAPDEGEEPPALDALPDEALREACEAVRAAVTAADEAGTVTIRLATATPWFMQLLAMPWASVLDREWMIEEGDWDGDCDGWVAWHDPAVEESLLFDRENGTGPYQLDAWKKKESFALEAWDDYWRTEPAWPGGPSGPPRLKHIVRHQVPEWSTRYAKLQSGEVDWADVPQPDRDQLADLVYAECDGPDEQAACTVVNEAGFLNYYSGYPQASAWALTFNFDIAATGGNPYIGSGELDGEGIPPDFFSDLDVRRGFNHCFDWETMIEEVNRGDAVQSRGPIISGLQGFEEDSPIYTFDLDTCVEELGQAWDGRLPEVGFELTVPHWAGGVEAEAVLEILADGLARANPKYRLETLPLEPTAMMADVNDRRLPMSIAGWGEDYHDASNWAFTYLHSGGAYGGYQSFPTDLTTRLDSLVEEAQVETDDAQRDRMYAELQGLAIDEATAIYLSQGLGWRYERREIHGVYVNLVSPWAMGIGPDLYSVWKEVP